MSDPYKPRAAFAPWDRRELPGLFSVEESARRVGTYKWLEMRLFEALGGWVATVPELDVKLVLGRHCYHHAWHAELMDKRLPELREMNTERLCEPANDEMVTFVDALREPEAPEHTIEKLVGVFRVLLPRKIAAYTYHLNGTSRITDSPTQRSLGLHAPGRVRGLAGGRDAAPVAHRDARGAGAGDASPAGARRPAAGGRRYRGARYPWLRRSDRRSLGMRKQLPPEMLARDSRFVRTSIMDQVMDPRNQLIGQRDLGSARLQPERPAAGDRARNLMHGIFTGEIQALEGAGRTTFDFDDEQAPFALKLDMARQCWDESRHVEISVKLGDWMGTEIGEYSEATFLYEAACAPDPILRLCGVNRALEGLAIDVFNTMKEFGDLSGDPVLEFCEDWMLADEVTHVKMGSDWLRRLTADDPERRERALDFQRTVDKLFSLGGFRGETDENPIQLARKLRQMAGFSTDEIDELAEIALQAKADAEAMVAGNS